MKEPVYDECTRCGTEWNIYGKSLFYGPDGREEELELCFYCPNCDSCQICGCCPCYRNDCEECSSDPEIVCLSPEEVRKSYDNKD